MIKESRIHKATALVCIFIAAAAGAAPDAMAETLSGSPLSLEEIASLQAKEEDSEELENIASGNILTLIGAAVVVYFVWGWLQSK